MNQIKIFKNDDGYILSLPKFSLYGPVVSIVLGVFLVLAILPFWDLIGADEWIAAVMVLLLAAFCEGFGGILIITHAGLKLVLDREGARLQRRFMKEKFIPWESVKDIGVACDDTEWTIFGEKKRPSHKFSYTLYVSPVRLSWKAGRRTLRMKDRALNLPIMRDDIGRLYEQGVFDLCLERINRDRAEEDRLSVYRDPGALDD